jgi:hypothetical protein
MGEGAQMTTVSIQLPSGLVKWAKHFAESQGQDLQDVVAEAPERLAAFREVLEMSSRGLTLRHGKWVKF